VGTSSPNPNPTSQGGGTASNSSETIPASRLQDVVNSNRNSLKRACWEPALSARGGAAGSAKVVVAFTIGSNGRVKSASATGGESYPTLGPCLAGRIRNWTFPSGYADTASQASFSFVSQG
jgi:outer membrane biosynthesis protein TonB